MADISKIKLPNNSVYNIKDDTARASIPTKTSELTNDSGFITSETDPVFSASAAAGITAADISNWNAKVSDDKTWKGVSLNKTVETATSDLYLPCMSSTSSIEAKLIPAYDSAEVAGSIARRTSNGYLRAATPSANDNSTNVATTAYVTTAISTASKPMLSGSTSTITPTQVVTALANGQNVELTYTDATYGTGQAYSFTYSDSLYEVVANVIFRYSDEWICCEIHGNTQSNQWAFISTSLATLDDISGITDEKLAISTASKNLTYYPILGRDATASTRQYTSNLQVIDAPSSSGSGYTQLTIGNTASSNGARGWIRLTSGQNQHYVDIFSGQGMQNNTTVYFPTASGTLALTSDIPSVPSNIVNTITTTAGAHTTISSSTGAVSFNVPTKTSHLTNDSGFITVDSDEKLKVVKGISTSNAYHLVLSQTKNIGTSETKKATDTLWLSVTSDTADLYIGGSEENLGTLLGQICLQGQLGVLTLGYEGSSVRSYSQTFQTKSGTIALTSDIPTVSYPVTSVNGQTGAITLSASDVGAQPTLVSGTNIKTINNQSILGSGNISTTLVQLVRW